MLYLLAILCPPLACLMAGRFWSSVLNFLLCCTIVLGPLAIIHAWYVVKDYDAERTLRSSPTVRLSVNTHSVPFKSRSRRRSG